MGQLSPNLILWSFLILKEISTSIFVNFQWELLIELVNRLVLVQIQSRLVMSPKWWEFLVSVHSKKLPVSARTEQGREVYILLFPLKVAFSSQHWENFWGQREGSLHWSFLWYSFYHSTAATVVSLVALKTVHSVGLTFFLWKSITIRMGPFVTDLLKRQRRTLQFSLMFLHNCKQSHFLFYSISFCDHLGS